MEQTRKVYKANTHTRAFISCAIAGIFLPFFVNAANITELSLASLGWQEKSFSGNTEYSLEAYGNTVAIKGQTSGQASALYRDEPVNLNQTPYLSWQWKVSNVFDNVKEKEKSGDDFPARLYVVHERGLFGWNTVAVNYVWSSHHAMGDTWSSAYTGKSKVVVLQSGSTETGQWVAEKRNVAEDFKSLFGIDVSTLSGYAVMVDGDNTGATATGWFADITFSEK